MNFFKQNPPASFRRPLIGLVMALLLLLAVTCAFAQAQPVVGQVTHLSGVLSVRHADGTRVVLSVKSAILQGDTLITERETYARVKFVDNGEIVLRPGSEVAVSKYLYDDKDPKNDSVAISLVKGGLRAVTGLVGKRNHDAVNFDTPTATIGIRGTHFGALYCQNDCGGVPTPNGQPPANGLHVDVVSGAIQVTNPSGTQLYSAGQFGFVPSISQPPVIVPPTQGVAVTMPPTISSNANTGTQKIGAAKLDACVTQ
ncbi:FecR domain-containing protein [Herbaspirillum sp. C7C8]|uniref:FecR family protein n=1 Tax=Herbaspirillum sp. C7C8 TaxID=2736665 RepID=UPI001F52068E|nr:FecR domain-containing protein [Herbaspirillum sp. C7C8]MCI1004642.1 FecR domain-containing protein [Herbaspirillum sp. C7C8]